MPPTETLLTRLLNDDELSSRRLRFGNNPNALGYRDRLSTWVLRIYCGAGGFPRFAQAGSSAQSQVADLLGIDALGFGATTEQQAIALLDAGWIRHREQFGDALAPVQPCNLQRCLQWLRTCTGLSDVEYAVLEFAVCAQCFAPLRRCLVLWDELNHGSMVQALSVLLDLPPHAVDAALSSRGRLVRSGLITLNILHGQDVLHRILAVPSYLGRTLAYYQGEPQNMLQGFLQALQGSRQNLTLDAFAHVQQHTDLATSWLKAALAPSRDGKHVNPDTYRAGHLLVSGAPGLGKTEWVRSWLAHCAGSIEQSLQAWELLVLDEEGNALTGQDRVRNLQMAIGLLAGLGAGLQETGETRKRSVLVFDEADDAFHAAQDPGGTDRGAASMANHRASLNRLMEDSQVPVVWIMNHPEVLDAAVLRRFDAVVHFRSVARSVRKRLLMEQLGSSVQHEEIERWADITELTPALIDRLCHVWKGSRAGKEGAGDNSTGMGLEQARHWLRERLPGRATRDLPAPAGNRPDKSMRTLTRFAWEAAQVNCNADLLQIAEGMRLHGSGRVLLYGPPGTGKTAFARHLARLLDKSLQEWRASDLLSPWVGGTEQRIDAVFEEALADDALVLIDEADSLVYARTSTLRSWEISQVNTLLQQLDTFEGSLVLASNRMDALDPALLRRMDVKVQFDYLRAEQIVLGFQALCARLAIAQELSEAELAVLKGIQELTPGDLACVARRAVLTGIPVESSTVTPARQLLELLIRDMHAKTGGRTPMGFLANGSSGEGANALARFDAMW